MQGRQAQTQTSLYKYNMILRELFYFNKETLEPEEDKSRCIASHHPDFNDRCKTRSTPPINKARLLTNYILKNKKELFPY